jgi:phage terminase large subunit-like protein
VARKPKYDPIHKHVAASEKYCDDVVSGEIPACKWVVAACLRQKDDRKRKDIIWRPEMAERICKFAELMPHIKGEWAKRKELIKLEPWQSFILTTVFGWYLPSGYRRFRTSYKEIPRKNAKSTLSSTVGNYMLTADGEAGSEVYSAATTRDQARIVFNDAQAMARKSPGLLKKYGVEVTARNIHVMDTSSKFEPLSAEGETLDGLNVHCGILDELHAHKKRDVFDVIETGTGSRNQSLLWLITTSGSNRAGICYEQRTYLTRILNSVLKRHPEIPADYRGGCIDDDSYFGIIYTIDEEQKDAEGKIISLADDWTTEAAWRKANPNYGISVKPDDIARLAHKAQNISSATNNFLTKRLNVWVNADTAWMNMRAWDKCGDPTLSLDDFKGQPCRMSFDLASKIDIAARGQLFTRAGHYYFFLKSYLPEDRIEESDNSQYAGWVKDGYITTTEGNVLDFDVFEEDLKTDSSGYEIKEVAFDPFQATQFSTRMMAEGFEMVEMRPTVLNFSEPMKELEKLVLQGRFHHNGDPVLAWMASNVVAHTDQKDNIYPRKEKAENKIDGIIALLMCLGREILQPMEESSVQIRFV